VNLCCPWCGNDCGEPGCAEERTLQDIRAVDGETLDLGAALAADPDDPPAATP
jgi:hypothetical protein